VLLGIVADSHGLPDKLREGIDLLRNRGVGQILHLGDVADALRPETVNECISLLIENRIRGVMGNHEYSLVMHHFKRYPEKFSTEAMGYVYSLPWLIEVEGICFTHFSPVGGVHGIFAPTDDLSYEHAINDSQWPIIVNGHSHDPRIYRQLNGAIENVKFEFHVPYQLDPASRYILTCGALEDAYCALLDLPGRRFEIISLE
jgi:predicted phosphodiesterase